MSKKVFLKIFSCIFALLFCQLYVNANPIPVFCMAGWLNQNSNFSKIQKEKSYILELEPSTGIQRSRYNLYDSYILELEPSTGIQRSRYNLY